MTPAYERRVTAKDEGTDWLYVDPASKSTHRVEIDVVPDKARRVRIQHLDRDMRGKAEWVPIARVKVPWGLREQYESTRARWKAAERHRPPTSHHDTALILLDRYVDERVAELLSSGVSGILEVHDLAELSAETGISESDLVAHEDALVDDASYLPWPTTLAVLKALCRRNPGPALELLGERRRDELKHAQRVGKEGDPWWVHAAREDDPNGRRVKQWHDFEAEGLAFLRTLVDDEHVGLAEDFLELRNMYLDFVRLAPIAVARIRMIPAQRSQTVADQLEALADRALPRSGELTGVEPPDPS